MGKLFILILTLGIFHAIESFSIDSLYVRDIKSDITIQKYIYILEDPAKIINIDTLLNHSQNFSFIKNTSPKLNFGFNPSTIWLAFSIKNTSEHTIDYILSISNPDLNDIDFFETDQNKIIKQFHTGELHDVNSREIFHRNFLFNIKIAPNKAKTYYLAFNNNGSPLFMPISIKERTEFYKTDNVTNLVYWLIYGLLIFIVIFNVYLYRSTRDRVSLYYSLYVLFAIIFFFCYDGYFYFFNPPVFVEKFKFLYPSFYTVFLLSFTQAFIGNNPKFLGYRKYLNPLKIIAVIAALFYVLPFPYSLVAEIGVPLLILSTLILIISIAFVTLNWKYSPSIMLLFAYIIVFTGLVIHELKEFDIFPPILIVENSSKFGLSLECIILTMAVLERFRINQDNAKETIQKSLLKIEGQNKELEIINTELEKLSIAASETNNSIAIYDKNGCLEWCNLGFEKFYGFTLDNLIEEKSDHIENILPNNDIDVYFKTCLNTRKPVSFETKVTSKGKKEKWVQTTLTPYPRIGNITKIIAIDSDISALKNYERDLEVAKEKAVESDRLKTVFLGNMSHEIRTPLNGILGFTELLGRTTVSEEKKERYYKLIMSNGEQLIRIIDDIVDISLIESNQLKMDETEFELNALIYDVIDFFEMYRSDIGKSNVQLILQNNIHQNTCKINSDPVRLKQVLMNLIKNSFKFTTEGYVRIESLCNNGSVNFIIEDTGIGIEPDKASIIFDRFRQGDESLSRKYGGTGLGLSISKGIIDKMGGKIWIDTEYQTGLRICFEIPKNSNNNARNQFQTFENNEDEKLNLLKNKNILVVEDDQTSFELLNEILSPYEITISHAVNGIEAVEYAKNKYFDIILMDINLPVMDGVGATREIRKFNDSIFILAQTAYAMKIEKDNILASGCNDIICKPLNSDELIDKLISYLASKN